MTADHVSLEQAAHPEGTFDLAILIDRLMGDESLAREVALEFLDDIPRQIEAMDVALAAADATKAHRHAHSIKGAAANVGCEALRAAAAEAEECCRLGALPAAGSLLPGLRKHFKEARYAIRAFIGTGS
jgi:HPt (histidine-containing phosphotransfer) domain-containing protein